VGSAYLQKLRLFNRDVRLYLFSMALIGLTIYGGIRSMLLNLYLVRLGYGPEFIGLINAAGSLGFSILALPAGALGPRWGTRRMMIAGAAVMVVGCGLFPLAEAVPGAWQRGWLVASNVVAWAGLAMAFVNGLPFLMSATGPEERNHAFSTQLALEPLAGFAGSLIGGFLPGLFASMLGVSLDDPAPYRYPLFISALLLVPALVALMGTREARTEGTQSRVADAGPVPYGLLVIMVLVVVPRLAGRTMVTTFFNLYLDTGLRASTSLIGALKAAGQLLAVPAALVVPLLVARWGKYGVISAGSVALAVCMLPLMLVPHWSAAGLGFMGVSALFAITTAPIRVFNQELVSPRWRGAMSGAVMMAAGLSSSATALAGGYIISALGYPSLFLMGLVATAAGAVLFWGYFRVPRGEMVRSPARVEDSC
jgi:MFS family permease